MSYIAPHVRDLDAALQLTGYVEECKRILTGDGHERIDAAQGELDELLAIRKPSERMPVKVINGVDFTPADRKTARMRSLTVKKVKKNRKWVKTVLLAESSSEDEAPPKMDQMLQMHKIRLRCLERFYQSPNLKQYKYYATNLLANGWDDDEEDATNIPSTSNQLPPNFRGFGLNRLSPSMLRLDSNGGMLNVSPPPKKPSAPRKKRKPSTAVASAAETPLIEPAILTSVIGIGAGGMEGLDTITQDEKLDPSSQLLQSGGSFLLAASTTTVIADGQLAVGPPTPSASASTTTSSIAAGCSISIVEQVPPQPAF